MIAELKFEIKAREQGFQTLRPDDAHSSYDVLLQNGDKFYRVQVKSTTRKIDNAYQLSCRKQNGTKKKQKYTKDDFEYLAAYVIPEDAWYLVPVGKVDSTSCLWLTPHRKSNRKFEKYKEDWTQFHGRNVK